MWELGAIWGGFGAALEGELGLPGWFWGEKGVLRALFWGKTVFFGALSSGFGHFVRKKKQFGGLGGDLGAACEGLLGFVGEMGFGGAQGELLGLL